MCVCVCVQSQIWHFFLQAPYKQMVSNLTQRCDQVIDPPAVYIATSQGNCTGAIILSRITHSTASKCTPEQILSQARSWATNNSRSDIQLEISTETCQPTYYKENNICPDLNYCDTIAQRAQTTWDQCRLLVATTDKNQTREAFLAVRRGIRP